MTAAEVQELIDDVPCDLCNVPSGLAMYLVAAALIDLSNGDPVPETTQELVSEANCLLCLVSPGLLPYVMIAAIRQLSTGGGLGAQEIYEGRDPLPPDDPTKPALSYPSGGGTLSQWDTTAQAWV